MAEPGVSIIIPTYNGEPWLDEQLASLAAQTYGGQIEIIVSDNGSSDGTVAVAEGWTDRLPGLRVVDSSQRRYDGYARNHGTAAAAHDILLYCDQDDVMDPQWVEATVAGLGSIDVAGAVAERDQLSPFPLGNYHTAGLDLGVEYVSTSGCGLTRATFDAVGGYDERLHSGGTDTVFCYQAVRQGLTVGMAPGAMHHYRMKSTPSAIYHQARRQGMGTVQLSKLFGPDLVPNRGWRGVATLIGTLLSRLPVAAVSRPHRYRWLFTAGTLTGLARGWRDERHFVA